MSDPAAEMRRELTELKNTIQLRERESQEQARQAEFDAVRDSVVRWVDASEDYPYVRAAGAGHLVYQQMLNHMQTTGEEMSEHEAARAINDQLVALRDKLNSVQLDTAVNEEPGEVTAPTLSNQQVADSTKANTARTGMITAAEAAAMLRFVEET